jgi:hypothetical protein
VTPKLFIATPTSDGIMLAGYVASLAALLTRLHADGLAPQYATLDGQDLIVQRNVLSERFLASDCTHLLFIDSDMLFPDDLASTLLALDKPLVGIVYTRRALDLARLKALAPERGFDAALALAHDWNLRPLGGGVTVQGGLAKVEGLGGGFLMIRRAVFERMLDCGALPVHEAAPGAREVRAFFHETRERDEIIDLDYSFCRRWIALGGEVWAYVRADVRHIGDWRHGPSFAAFLHALGSATAQP